MCNDAPEIAEAKTQIGNNRTSKAITMSTSKVKLAPICVKSTKPIAIVVNANVKAITTTLIPQLNEGPVKLNIGTGVGTTVNEIARLVKKEIQRQFPRIKIQKTVTAPFRQGDLLINKLDPRLAEVCLDWKPTVKLADGIRRTVGWFGASRNADS